MQNQRKFERYDLVLSVYLKDKSGAHQIKTGNVSRYGLFLETAEPKPMRQLVQLVIEFPDKRETIETLAQVMWSDATGESARSEGTPGMGIKFFSMTEKQRRSWESFVDLVRTGRVEQGEEEKPKSAKRPKDGVYVIGEEELEELEDLENLGKLVSIEDVIDFEKEPAPVRDLSKTEAEYERSGPKVKLPNEDDEIERRVYPRKPASFLVKLRDVDTLRELFTRDISLGGMFIKTTITKIISDEVAVVIVHPWTSEEFSLQAKVKRIEKNAVGNPCGFGVGFVGMDDRLRDMLLTYIESGYVIRHTNDDTPIEAEVIRRIEQVEHKIKDNPIDSKLHYEIGLLYFSLPDWEKSHEHIEIASKLGYNVPSEIISRLEGKVD